MERMAVDVYTHGILTDLYIYKTNNVKEKNIYFIKL